MPTDPYMSADSDNIIAFLVSTNRLHEVLGSFIDAPNGTYNRLKAEQVLIEFMLPECTDALIRHYVAKVNIHKEYNDWWFLYHRTGDGRNETL